MNEEVVMAEEKETKIVKCPNCGGSLIFSPEAQKLVCEHCGSEVDIEANRDVRPVDFLTGAAKGEDWGNETVVYRCNNCGAKEILAKTDISRICPFCGTTNVVASDELPGERPTAVVPFSVNEDGARTAFRKWLKKKWFTPNALKKGVKTDRFNGVYNACFVYDANTVSQYSGTLGRYYTTTVGTGKNRRTVTKIRYFYVSGTYQQGFENFLIEASPHLTQKIANDLKPYSYEQAALYDEKFLSGFSASGYDEDVNVCWGRAKTGMDEIIRRGILSQYHADVVQSLNVSTGYYQVRYKYLLLPVWFCNFKFRKKKYDFFVNGTTAKVAGKVPRSPVKIGLFSLGMAAILALIIFLILQI